MLELKFKEWLSENEFDIRRTAIRQMNSHILDNISKELSIVKNNFAFNPKDIKFTGRFIDLISFTDIDNKDDISIDFLEIKTGNSSLNKKQKLIREAIFSKRVYFKTVQLK